MVHFLVSGLSSSCFGLVSLTRRGLSSVRSLLQGGLKLQKLHLQPSDFVVQSWTQGRWQLGWKNRWQTEHISSMPWPRQTAQPPAVRHRLQLWSPICSHSIRCSSVVGGSSPPRFWRKHERTTSADIKDVNQTPRCLYYRIMLEARLNTLKYSFRANWGIKITFEVLPLKK